MKHPFFVIKIGFFLVLASFFFNASAFSAQSRGITLEKTDRANQNRIDPARHGVYRALIIGNNDYRNGKTPWPKLETALSGAHAVKKILQTNYGFSDVQLLENATRRDVLIALQELSRRVLTNDNVLVYYAGHGYLDTETNKGYWVPVDAKGTDQTTFLRNSTIRDELTIIASRARHTLLISDSCFSGTLLRSGSRGIAADSGTERYYKKVANKKSVQIMSAGGVEFVDDNYNRSGHSPFTYFLLNELRTNNRPLLTLSELSSNVEKAVANNVEQVPESGVLQGAGDELGEFIFIKVDVTVEGIPKENIKVDVHILPKKTAPEKKEMIEPSATHPEKQTEKQDKNHRRLAPLPTF
ncbi:MAG: caspase family protein [Nitrospirota bacterium]|nr:caspase family protein [Nitrospirota bacterium]